MATFCIPKFGIDKIKQAIADGTINVDEMTNMSSADRRNLFEDIVGREPAKELNAEFESRLLLKNQKLALERWVNKFSDLKEPVRRDMLTKVQKLRDVLDDNNIETFKQDLIEKKLDITPTIDEANELARLAKDVEAKKAKIENDYAPNGKDFSDERIAYGEARADFDAMMDDLSNPGNKFGIKGQLKDYFKEIKANPLTGFTKLGGVAKSLKAGLDNSALLRQGLKTAFTHPRIWAKNAAESFKNMWKTYGGKDVMREVKARMYADPQYDLIANEMKVAIGADDYIPSTIQEKIPVFGRVFKASDNAFSGFMYKTRFDIAKKYLQIAEKAGEDISDKEFLTSVGRLVNSQTGRGFLGRFEAAGNDINTLFFSPRFLKAQLDTVLHALNGAGAGFGSFAQKEAAKSLGKFIAGIGGIIGTAYLMNPDSVELDPRSTNFMKIKVGNSWNDVSGGFGSVITLLSRMFSQSTKSGLTGKVTKLGERDEKGNLKYGARTFGDTFVDFGRNKFSPILSVLGDLATQNTFYDKKPTLGYELGNLVVPLPVMNAIQRLQDPDTAETIASQLLDMLGSAGTNYTDNKFKQKK